MSHATLAQVTTLRMVPASLRLLDAELQGELVELARGLGVKPVGEWPPIGGEHDIDAVRFFRRFVVELLA